MTLSLAYAAGVGGAGVSGAGAAYSGGSEPASLVVLNSADKGANIVLSNGDLTATNSVNATFHSVRTTASPITSGVRYWEIVLGSTAAADNIYYVGIATAAFVLTGVPGGDAECFAWRLGTNPPALRYNGGGSTGNVGVQGTSGDVIGLLFDRSNKTLTAWQNSTSLGNIFTTAGHMDSIAGAWEPFVCVNGAGGVAKSVTARFANSSWSYPSRASNGQQW